MQHTAQQIVAGRSKRVTAGAASASTTIPTRVDGANAKIVRVVSNKYAYVDFGQAAITAAAATSVMIAPGVEQLFYVNGCSHMAYIEETTDAGALVSVSPLENQ